MPSLSRTRWVLAGALGLLSAVAVIATSTKETRDSFRMPEIATDIQAPGLLLGSSGLGGLMLLRCVGSFAPKPWRVYVDRLEFTFVAMLWVLWTSATVAFSASSISKTICTDASYHSPISQCSTLTFDLILLHVLSLSAFAYLLVVLSTALSPGYHASHSSLSGDDGLNSDGVHGEEGSVFVMWELALRDSPKGGAAALPESVGTAERSYGTAGGDMGSTVATESVGHPTVADKFARGRVGMYASLLLMSIAVMGALAGLSTKGFPGIASILVLALAASTAAFTSSFLYIHRRQRAKGLLETSRRLRALELSVILAFFLLWPIAATLYTLSPSGAARPCDSPVESAPGDDAVKLPGMSGDTDMLNESIFSVCNLTLITPSLAWAIGWLSLARAIGLVFPGPDPSSEKPSISVPILGHSRGLSAGGEGDRLLGGHRQAQRGHEAGAGPSADARVERPQVKYGRLVAGEAFELGDEDD